MQDLEIDGKIMKNPGFASEACLDEVFDLKKTDKLFHSLDFMFRSWFESSLNGRRYIFCA